MGNDDPSSIPAPPNVSPAKCVPNSIGRRAEGGEVQRCITPAIGSRVQVVLLLQRESVVIVAVPVPHHVVNA